MNGAYGRRRYGFSSTPWTVNGRPSSRAARPRAPASSRCSTVLAAVPVAKAALPGLVLAGVLGYALNDSGIAIPAAMLSTLVPTAVFVAFRLPGLTPAAEAPAPAPVEELEA